MVLPSFIGRATVMWLLVRLALLAVGSAGGALAGDAADPASRLLLAPSTALLAAAAVTALVLVDLTALRERAFLANLGVDRRRIAVVAFLTALGLEATVSTVAAVLA
jgi:hypothetical protein